MKVNVTKIAGNWDDGYVLDKHIISSNYVGDNDYGHAQYDTTRTEVGEALYRLKYQSDRSQIVELAGQISRNIIPNFETIQLILPMPSSTARGWQPVNEIATRLGRLIGARVFDNILIRSAQSGEAQPIKNLATKNEKRAALKGQFTITDSIKDDECWNALLLDDLFDTGATMEAACATIRTYRKIGKVYVAALTESKS